jgi:hypothetical protein
VVVLENIQRHLDMGKEKRMVWQAVELGAGSQTGFYGYRTPAFRHDHGRDEAGHHRRR